jgi:hypothetical protein
MKIETVVSKSESGLRIEQNIEGDRTSSYCVVKARRVVHPERGDEVQLELRVSTAPNRRGSRWSTQNSSFILTRDQARELALTMFPELKVTP